MVDRVVNARNLRADPIELLQGIVVIQAFTLVLIATSHVRLICKLRKIDFKQVTVTVNNPPA